MVVFTCNHCGESLKKNNVEKHMSRCNKNVSVSCMDCFKDFDRQSYSAHTQCVTELQRYSGKDYVPKANLNKGQKKQEAWVDIVRSITDKKSHLSNGVKKILETISSYDNIPRKKAKFLNFMKNSFRYMKHNELEEAWTLLEEALKDNKGPAVQDKKVIETSEVNGKRKLDEEKVPIEDNNEESEIIEPPQKKKKKNESNDVVEYETLPNEQPLTIESSEKFSWNETIRSILSQKCSEFKLKKLKKKVLKKYQILTGDIWSEKQDNKFLKKIQKLKGVEVVDNEKVRLVG